jgi:hypothetical protein
VWKKNRNLYAVWLLDMVLNRKLDKPFTKVPGDGNLDMLQATEVKATLSAKVKAVLAKRDKSEERRMEMPMRSREKSPLFSTEKPPKNSTAKT